MYTLQNESQLMNLQNASSGFQLKAPTIKGVFKGDLLLEDMLDDVLSLNL